MPRPTPPRSALSPCESVPLVSPNRTCGGGNRRGSHPVRRSPFGSGCDRHRPACRLADIVCEWARLVRNCARCRYGSELDGEFRRYGLRHWGPSDSDSGDPGDHLFGKEGLGTRRLSDMSATTEGCISEIDERLSGGASGDTRASDRGRLQCRCTPTMGRAAPTLRSRSSENTPDPVSESWTRAMLRGRSGEDEGHVDRRLRLLRSGLGLPTPRRFCELPPQADQAARRVR